MKIADWVKHDYEVVTTQDGSPTLRSLKTSNQESMHHSGGAYSETQLIYGEPLRQGITDGKKYVFSLGLGLGYNEVLAALEFYRNKIDGKILTFESETILRESFLNYIAQPKEDSIYTTLLNDFSRDYGLSVLEICHILQDLKLSQRWILNESLHAESSVDFQCDMILFDAFSNKSSPELWTEDFLVQFIQKYAKEKCFFSTYACTGNLKRALLKNSFQLIERPGFHGKRNSILGARN